MLFYYRVFGNPSQEFLHYWLLAHGFISLFTVLVTIWLSRYEWISKRLNLVVIFALLVVGLTDYWIEQKTKADTEQFQAIAKLKGGEPNTIYIIPSDWNSFRMNAQKAVFVDENLVYGPALPSLMNRLELMKANDYNAMLGSIPAGTTIKLIAPNSGQIPEFISRESITENYTCHKLRQ
jgi:hypothetical protein